MDFGYAVRVAGGFGFGKQAGTLRIGDQHGIQQAFLAIRGFLRQKTHAGIARHADTAILGVQLAGQQVQQC